MTVPAWLGNAVNSVLLRAVCRFRLAEWACLELARRWMCVTNGPDAGWEPIPRPPTYREFLESETR